MYVVREIMFCKPGKVRPMVEKFRAMSRLGENAGMPRMRIMTDVSAEAYWTVVAEMEMEDLAAFEAMQSVPDVPEEDRQEWEKVMEGYHDLVDHGRREIYRIEA